MGTEGTGFRGLAVAAKAERPADVGEEASRLRIPTMEERALIFLRATQGSRDFPGDEHAEARSKILDVMAADIV
jgi:hypothetical protein